MAVKRVSVREAEKLLAERYRYVDVRSIPEYEAGHPPGAYSIPLLHFLPGRGMSPNPEFMGVFQRHFQQTDKVIVGCKVGNRSLRAAEMLHGAGFTEVVDMRGGFEGEPSAEGWRPAGLPVETASADRGWESLKK